MLTIDSFQCLLLLVLLLLLCPASSSNLSIFRKLLLLSTAVIASHIIRIDDGRSGRAAAHPDGAAAKGSNREKRCCYGGDGFADCRIFARGTDRRGIQAAETARLRAASGGSGCASPVAAQVRNQRNEGRALLESKSHSLSAECHTRVCSTLPALLLDAC